MSKQIALVLLMFLLVACSTQAETPAPPTATPLPEARETSTPSEPDLPTATPGATPTPGPVEHGLLQAYYDESAGISLWLPNEWSVEETTDEPAGATTRFSPLSGAAGGGAIVVADAGGSTPAEQAKLLCNCEPSPLRTISLANGTPAQFALLGGADASPLPWYFIEHNSRVIGLTFHDGESGESLDAIVNSLSLGRPAASGPDTQPAASAARFALADELATNPYRILIGGLQPTEWPDGCLGVSDPETACRPGAILGYAVTLRVGNRWYQVNTDESGEALVRVPGAGAPAGGLTLVRREGDGCDLVTLEGKIGVLAGPCDGALKVYLFGAGTPGAAKTLGEFGATYAPFSAETPAGTITFNGLGTTAAGATIQRQIAETARWIANAAVPEAASEDAQRALAWHREGGIAGFCDDLVVYTYGEVVGATCQGGRKTPLGGRWLSAGELETLYDWLDSYGPFEESQKDPAGASDAMTVSLLFEGNGEGKPAEAELQAILDFAAGIYAEIRTEGPVAETVIGDPEQVVVELLQHLIDDPTGASSEPHLSADLRARVTAGKPLTWQLGIENLYRSFNTKVIDDGRLSGVATVEATLHFFSDYPVKLTLVPEEDAWRVSAIEALAPRFSYGATRPGLVTEDFLMELLRDSSGRSSAVFLSDAMRDELGEGGVLELLGIDAAFSSFEYVIVDNGVGDGSAVVEVTLSYETPVKLTFSLTLVEELWRISAISS